MKLHPSVELVQKLAAKHGLQLTDLYYASLAAVILEDSQCLLNQMADDPDEDPNDLPTLEALVADWKDGAVDDPSGFLDDVDRALSLLGD